MAHTGENEMGLRKIIDMTRFASIFILVLHFYFYCYAAFKEWALTSSITDKLLTNITRTGLLEHLHTSKLIALGLLIVSLMGARGKKNEKLQPKTILLYLIVGVAFYFSSFFILRVNASIQTIAMYIWALRQ